MQLVLSAYSNASKHSLSLKDASLYSSYLARLGNVKSASATLFLPSDGKKYPW